jgi:hypothetical protein
VHHRDFDLRRRVACLLCSWVRYAGRLCSRARRRVQTYPLRPNYVVEVPMRANRHIRSLNVFLVFRTLRIAQSTDQGRASSLPGLQCEVAKPGQLDAVQIHRSILRVSILVSAMYELQCATKAGQDRQEVASLTSVSLMVRFKNRNHRGHTESTTSFRSRPISCIRVLNARSQSSAVT